MYRLHVGSRILLMLCSVGYKSQAQYLYLYSKGFIITYHIFAILYLCMGYSGLFALGNGIEADG